MILDERAEFCDATSAAINIGNAIIGDVIDTGLTSSDLGPISDLALVIQVDTSFVGVNGTVKFEFCSDSTADLATSKTVHFATDAIPVATLVAGYQMVFKLPYATYERYLGLWETVATTNVTAGKINAFLTSAPAKYTVYADAVN